MHNNRNINHLINNYIYKYLNNLSIIKSYALVNILPGECTLSSRHDMNWTKEENKEFGRLLIEFPIECPMRFECIANYLPNKSTDQVRMHYETLVSDVYAIENGLVLMPDYYHNDEVFATDNKENNNKIIIIDQSWWRNLRRRKGIQSESGRKTNTGN